MKNNYLLLDFGNSYIKGAIYDANKKQIVETRQCKKTTNCQELLSQFRLLKKGRVTKIIEAATTCSGYIVPFNKGMKKRLGAEIKNVVQSDFKDLLDLSNINRGVVIGIDILISAFYCSKMFKNKCAFISLGTAYYAIIVKKARIENCYLLPSLTKGLNTVCALTAIPKDYLPKVFDQNIGKDTPSSFSAGLNIALEGFMDTIVSQNRINKKNVVLTGGDVFKYKNITKKYKETKNAVLIGLAKLVKEKKW